MIRYKDLIVSKIVFDPDNHIVELYGAELDGQEAWIMLHMPTIPEIKGANNYGNGEMDRVDWGHFVTSGMSWTDYQEEQNRL